MSDATDSSLTIEDLKGITLLAEAAHFGNVLGLTAGIVSAYVSHNAIPFTSLPGLIRLVRATLSEDVAVIEVATATTQPAIPAVAIGKSITPDHLVSLLDGKPYKSLKRHLTAHGLPPDEYRQKFGLPSDYPMVAANYAKARSELAKAMGLGQMRRAADAAPPVAQAA